MKRLCSIILILLTLSLLGTELVYEYEKENVIKVFDNNIYEVSTLDNEIEFSIYSTETNETMLSDSFDFQNSKIIGKPSIVKVDSVVTCYFNVYNNENSTTMKLTFDDYTYLIQNTNFSQDIYHIEHFDENFAIALDNEFFDLSNYQQMINNSNDYKNSDTFHYGGDNSFQGKFHSNSNLGIRHTSQHNNADNNGWPRFSGETSICDSEIDWLGSDGEISSIFTNGLSTESYKLYALRSKSDSILISPDLNDNDILFVDLQGSQMELYKYSFETREDTINIYRGFPNPNGDDNYNIFATNTLTVVDTTITQLNPIALENQTFYYQPNEIWIKGNVSGQYIFGSDKDIRILDDISYTNTPLNEMPVNNDDYLVLYSKGNVIISYGYIDPVSGQRLKPNCHNVFVYASIILDMSKGEGDYNGLFTYEYQDPQPFFYDYHTWYAGTDSAYVDPYPDALHMYNLNNWPSHASSPIDHYIYNIDYPFRNPLFPEHYPVYLRGELFHFGATFQHRRGYLRRSGESSLNHVNSHWNLQYDLWGAESEPNGYDYYEYFDTIPDNDFFNNHFSITSSLMNDFRQKLIALDSEVIIGDFPKISKSHKYIFARSDIGFIYYYDSIQEGIFDLNGSQLYASDSIVDMKANNSIIFIEKMENNYLLKSLDNGEVSILLEFAAEELNESITLNVNSENQISVFQSFIRENSLNTTIYLENSDNDFSVNSISEDLSQNDFIVENISLDVSSDNDLYYYIAGEDVNLLVIKDYVATSVQEYVSTKNLDLDLAIYPSPYFKSIARSKNIDIKFSLLKKSKVDIAIYNLKGQKIKDFGKKVFAKGDSVVSWDLTNSSHNNIASGVYFIKVSSSNKTSFGKVMIIK